MSSSVATPPPPKIPAGDLAKYFTCKWLENKGALGWRFQCTMPNCSSSYAPSSSSSTLRSHFRTAHPRELSAMSSPYQRQQDVIEAAIQMIVGIMSPLDTLDCPEFRNIILLVNPQITIPDATGLLASLAAHRVQLEHQLRDFLDMTLEEGSLSIEASRIDNPETGECEWYINVTLHWLDTDYVPRACVLDVNEVPFPESAAVSYLRDLLNKWGLLDKITAATYDDEIVSESTLRKVSPLILPVPCPVRSLNRCVISCLEQSKELRALINKFRKLALYFIQDKWANCRLISFQEDPSAFGSSAKAKKVRPVIFYEEDALFWTSEYDMLERLVQIRPDIDAHIPFIEFDEDREELAKVLPTDADWKQAIALVRSLNQLYVVHKHFVHKEGFVTKKYPLAARISSDYEVLLEQLSKDIRAINTLPPEVQAPFTAFRVALAAQLPKTFPMSTSLTKVAILHPLFNHLRFLQDDAHRQTAIEELRAEYTALVDADAQIQIDEHGDGTIEFESVLKRRRLQYQQTQGDDQVRRETEFDRYMLVEVDQKVDPLEWWRANRESYPVMAHLARKYLGIVGSSIGTHRGFSSEDSDEKRVQMEEDAICDMIVCHYAALAVKDFEPSGDQAEE